MTDQPIAWLPIDTAPNDGTLILLLCIDPEGSIGQSAMPTEDGELWRTIGNAAPDNDDGIEWQMAGWCSSHDHFTEGRGQPTHWLPLPYVRHPAGEASYPAMVAMQRRIDELETALGELTGAVHLVKTAQNYTATAQSSLTVARDNGEKVLDKRPPEGK